MKHEVG